MTDSSASAQRPDIKAVFNLAWPLTLKAIMLHGIVVIDAYLVSALGETSVAVLGLSASIAGLLLGLIVAFSNATQIRIAQAFGSGDEVFLKSALLSGLTINVTVVLAGLALLGLAAGTIIDGLAHDAWIAAEARRYLSVFAIVVVAESVGHCLTSFFNGCGETRMPALSYVFAVPINICASVVLIHGLFGAPQLGVVGAALGSALASVLQVGFLGVVLLSRHAALLRVPGWRNGSFAATLRRHLTFSLPIAATFASATLSMSVCGLIYATLPVNQFAAMTIINPWVQVAGTVGMCWAQATGIFVAQLLGRRTSEDVLDAFLSDTRRVSFVAAALVAMVYAFICLSTPWLYSELHAETQATLLSFLPILLVLPFPKGSNAICGNTLRAGGETVYVMHIFVWSQWLFRVPATALMVLVLDLSVTWVFALLLAEELVKYLPFHMRLNKGDWKRASVDH
ncbi:MATE family efflux transporter [Tropicibacter oceani]|uniref:MATE family efflux transporter n=1 Tax=Tropicibacter oceani TaxID=3058420 RepID=A0ABY8QMV9_9RHOB|nr:MATE family efflux transporter [Tropicibacter oceani]WGW05966.1 MATE family efflux transporter [Tropicibacter oceani]